MKILEIIPTLGSGGAERFVVDLCNEMSLANEVTLVVFYNLDNPLTSFYANEVSNRVKIITLGKHKGLDLRLFFKLNKLINKIKPDVIHTHLAAIIYIQLSLFFNNKPIYVHTVHNDAFKEIGKNILSRISRIYSFKNRRIIPVTISNESRESFIKCYGMYAPLIYNGRNLPLYTGNNDDITKEILKYKKNENTRIIINLARIQIQKRQDIIAKVAKRLYLEGYNFCVLIIGKVQDKKIEDFVKTINSDNIYFLGERHNPIEYLSRADAYTLASSHEGMPISLIEALSVGCIPLCTPVGGCKDVIINGKNGLLSEDISEESYYKMLKEFLSLDNNDIEKMKSTAKESYNKYTMTECSKQYISLFKSRASLQKLDIN